MSQVQRISPPLDENVDASCTSGRRESGPVHHGLSEDLDERLMKLHVDCHGGSAYGEEIPPAQAPTPVPVFRSTPRADRAEPWPKEAPCQAHSSSSRPTGGMAPTGRGDEHRGGVRIAWDRPGRHLDPRRPRGPSDDRAGSRSRRPDPRRRRVLDHGFWITEQTTQPDMGHSIELGEGASSWTAAEEFVQQRAQTGLMFEVVADEDTGDIAEPSP
jgi:hypothetical protein